jgi:hypothetical protein
MLEGLHLVFRRRRARVLGRWSEKHDRRRRKLHLCHVGFRGIVYERNQRIGRWFNDERGKQRL